MEKLQVDVPKGATLLVEGESLLEFVHGKAEIFGYEPKPGFKFRIERFKASPVYAVESFRARITGGKVSLYPGKTIPESWYKVIDEVRGASRPVVVMVVGGVDVGKTGLITYVANRLTMMGEKVGIVDADTGQSSIGPPTTIGLGILTDPVPSLSLVEPFDAVFVGSTSPSGILERSVSAVVQMVRLAVKSGAGMVLVDTTGWVSGEGGRQLKLAKVDAVSPSLIVALERGMELEHLLKYWERFYKVLRVNPAVELRSRTRDERYTIRGDIYRRWFEGAQPRLLTIDDYVYCNSFLFTGVRLPAENLKEYADSLGIKVLYGEAVEDKILLVAEDSDVQHNTEASGKLHIVKIDTMKNVLISFRSREKRFLGLGILLDVDFENGKLKVLTRVDPSKAEAIEFGNIKVNPETFQEEGWIQRWCF